MANTETLIFSRSDVERLLTLDRPYFAAKTNANFPRNGARHGLPTIQGVVVLCDAANGFPLAVMDSISITALRTAAATAVAAKYLAREECAVALVCGCGAQGAMQLRALCRVRQPKQVYAYDQDANRAAEFARNLSGELGIRVTPAHDLGAAVAGSDIVITCTTSQRFFITHDMVRPGTFIAAVWMPTIRTSRKSIRNCLRGTPLSRTSSSNAARSAICTTRSSARS